MTPNSATCQHTTHQGLKHGGINIIILYKEFYTVFNHEIFSKIMVFRATDGMT